MVFLTAVAFYEIREVLSEYWQHISHMARNLSSLRTRKEYLDIQMY